MNQGCNIYEPYSSFAFINNSHRLNLFNEINCSSLSELVRSTALAASAGRLSDFFHLKLELICIIL